MTFGLGPRCSIQAELQEHEGEKIRTPEGTKPADFESAPFDRFGTPSFRFMNSKSYKPEFLYISETAIVSWSHLFPFRTQKLSNLCLCLYY